jgi:hypothetical protein
LNFVVSVLRGVLLAGSKAAHPALRKPETPMTTKKILAAVFALLLAPLVHAAPIGGTWEGTWTQGAGGGTVTMVVTGQTPGTPSDALTGYFDWECTFGGFVCSGRELFTGTLTDAFFDVIGFALQNDVNLGLGEYFGLLSADGQSIAGSFTPAGSEVVVGTWTVNRVLNGVPEPTSIALLGLGFGVLLVTTARRREQAPR